MSNKLCQLLGIEYPIIQEPVHTLTNGKMIAAISEAGALGTLGINAGYTVNDANSGASSSSKENIGNIKEYSILDTMTERNLMNEQIDSALENTFRPFAIEVASSEKIPKKDPTAEAIVQLMRKRRLTIALFEGFGNIASPEWVTLLHNNGIRIMQKVNNTTEAQKAISNKCDILICTNINNLDSITQLNSNIPVVAGGDLTTKDDIIKVFSKGAQGIFISTLFNISKEAPTDIEIKNRVINSKSNDLVSFNINNHVINSLPGSLPNKLAKMNKENIDTNEIFEKANRYQGLINGMAKGNLSTGYTTIAPKIDTITEINSIDDIVSTISSYISKI